MNITSFDQCILDILPLAAARIVRQRSCSKNGSRNEMASTYM